MERESGRERQGGTGRDREGGREGVRADRIPGDWRIREVVMMITEPTTGHNTHRHNNNRRRSPAEAPAPPHRFPAANMARASEKAELHSGGVYAEHHAATPSPVLLVAL